MFVLGFVLGFAAAFLLAAAAVANVREMEQAVLDKVATENKVLLERIQYLEGVCATSCSSSVVVP